METSGGDRARRLMSLLPVFFISIAPPLSRSKSVCPSLALHIYKTSPFSSPMLLFFPIRSSKEFWGTMTFWLFLISFAPPLPLSVVVANNLPRPSSSSSLKAAETMPHPDAISCKTVLEPRGGTHRPTAIRPRWPEELETGQSLWADGAEQGRGNKACSGSRGIESNLLHFKTSWNYFYPAF